MGFFFLKYIDFYFMWMAFCLCVCVVCSHACVCVCAVYVFLYASVCACVRVQYTYHSHSTSLGVKGQFVGASSLSSLWVPGTEFSNHPLSAAPSCWSVRPKPLPEPLHNRNDLCVLALGLSHCSQCCFLLFLHVPSCTLGSVPCCLR